MSPVIPAHVVPHRRLDVPFAGDEMTMLSAFLDRYRETMLWKLEGLSTEQASAHLVPSVTTLLGMVKHLAYVERSWFQMYFAGGPVNFPWAKDEPDQDIDFRISPTDTIESISALYQQEIARSREIVAGASLEDLSKNQERGPRSLRWIMVHMIEETARHAGHADILRELTDGAIGQ
jgi:uncharacterized damage-inducible protein DinB